MMRDRLINHAIRQAYEGHLDDNQQPAYVLYLTIDPQQVDVNVHPAKHEVRFHQARLVHDFIYQGVRTALLNAHGADELPGIEPVTHELANRTSAGDNYFSSPTGFSAQENKQAAYTQEEREQEHDEQSKKRVLRHHYRPSQRYQSIVIFKEKALIPLLPQIMIEKQGSYIRR